MFTSQSNHYSCLNMSDVNKNIDNDESNTPRSPKITQNSVTDTRSTTSKWVNNTGITKLTETLFDQLNMNQTNTQRK